MRIHPNKSAQAKALIEILLLLVGAAFLVMVIKIIAEDAEEVTAEILCRGFNALSIYKVGAGGLKVSAPKACNTFDKTGKSEIPTKDYERSREGVKTQIRDMIARCWWMWLDGRIKNMFDSRFYDFQDPGFICYTFTIKEGMLNSPITITELEESLLEPYHAIDKTDRCASGGNGGLCGTLDLKKECVPKKWPSGISQGSDYFSRSSGKSDRCAEDEFCCVSKYDEECKDKGGKCLPPDNDDAEFVIYYKDWKCDKGNRCYIRRENAVSTLSYIQGTEGSDSGPGALLYITDTTRANARIEDELKFRSGEQYAITFLSPGKEFDFSTVAWGTGTVISGVATFLSLKLTAASFGLAAPVTLGLGGLTAWMHANYIDSGTVNDINYIILSKYSNVKDKYIESTTRE